MYTPVREYCMFYILKIAKVDYLANFLPYSISDMVSTAKANDAYGKKS